MVEKLKKDKLKRVAESRRKLVQECLLAQRWKKDLHVSGQCFTSSTMYVIMIYDLTFGS